jgi:hypothetical protein
MVVPNDDYTFDIYVNESYSETRQRKVISHELEHIKRDHFYRDIPITVKEAEASAAPPISDCELADEFFIDKVLAPVDEA